MNKLVKSELGIRFLASLENHKLVKFISLEKKFDSVLVKAFYFNMSLSPKGLECQFSKK